ncbi:hypothetical protein [Sphingobacterium sp. LRF_L2]|uniref:hypothetical protein n=1 Tax=Sphingobacterium sp. LRF_L2 TaxID=3369421 RepID=UPI003F62D16E
MLVRMMKKLLIHIAASQQGVPLEKRKLWSKQDVMEKLGMTDRTYERNLKNGKLIPMRLNGADMFFEEDIVAALEESRRKGKI